MFTKEDYNMSVKAQITEMVNLIPEAELPTVLELVRHFVPVNLDDVATADDLAAHDAAMKEYRAGETVAHNAINWD